MILLVLDTAGQRCAAALIRVEDGAVTPLAVAEEVMTTGHAEKLLPMVAALRQEAPEAWAALDRIAVTTGPGSFTGVRIGIAAARGLALALKRPVVGIGVLDALAASGNDRSGPVRAILDARRDQVYRQDFGPDGTPLTPPAAVSVTDALAERGAPTALIGSGAPLLACRDHRFVVLSTDPPALTAIAKLAAAAPQADRPPVPLYLRPPDAKPQAGKHLRRAAS